MNEFIADFQCVVCGLKFCAKVIERNGSLEKLHKGEFPKDRMGIVGGRRDTVCASCLAKEKREKDEYERNEKIANINRKEDGYIDWEEYNKKRRRIKRTKMIEIAL